ncbi:hypothetical protein ASY01nite_03620 [Acetobacter syzygii]|nr:hypothetical protein Absy_027_112 [Acetobacter syzygii]GEL55296.1 hypothetical protein ASY01nite_03620 [Acetobacter syzygii]
MAASIITILFSDIDAGLLHLLKTLLDENLYQKIKTKFAAMWYISSISPISTPDIDTLNASQLCINNITYMQ